MAAVATVGAQLALPVLLPDDALFKTFEPGANEELLRVLSAVTSDTEVPGSLYLWGGTGLGKTHLLHAVCAAADLTHMQVMYVPLADFSDPVHISLLQGLEHYDLVCLDDIDKVTMSPDWCVALFELYNRLADSGKGRLVVAASVSPLALSCALPDLRSRLQASGIYQLQRLSDEQRVAALQTHASQRGLQLEADVAQFIVQRVSRDMHQLMAILNQLDKASMAQQRRLTVPFVKQTLTI